MTTILSINSGNGGVIPADGNSNGSLSGQRQAVRTMSETGAVAGGKAEGRTMNQPGRARGAAASTGPWYQHPWAIFVFALPAIVVVASFTTLWIAVTHQDALVNNDPYGSGLAINASLAREQTAANAGLAADVAISGDAATPDVAISLSGHPDMLAKIAASGETPVLYLNHPDLTAQDRKVALARSANGLWHGRLNSALPQNIHWRAVLETATWRVEANAAFKPGQPLRLSAITPAE